MFRNPRDNSARSLTEAILPSTGRPPTPPQSNSSPYFSLPTMSTAATTSTPTGKLPVLGTQRTPPISSVVKKGGKQNQRITNFFIKSDRKEEETEKENEINDGLFFGEKGRENSSPFKRVREGGVARDDENERFNEDDTPVKKRRLNDGDLIIRTPSPEPRNEKNDASKPDLVQEKKQTPKRRGGFVDDSDSEDELDENEKPQSRIDQLDGINDVPDDVEVLTTTTTVPLRPAGPDADSIEEGFVAPIHDFDGPPIPALSRESTSMFHAGEFGDDDDFEADEFFEEGEEFMERRWMQEQLEMEIGLDEDSKSEGDVESIHTPSNDFGSPKAIADSVASCPICAGSLKNLSESQASTHVNACLDGTAEPLPPAADPPSIPQPIKSEFDTPTSSPAPPTGAKRFHRAGIARPAQANPFASSKDPKTNSASAFSRLMSGNTEDAAWAAAAAAEASSRGKPAYARTCPFYKIMPGFYICVDAFRYGKVQGQNAYFLSHFHSDHYIGLTSNWAHGPIYASKVTCNLMRTVLRVDPKWIRPLEFESEVEIPGTKGVKVTMIPANHCPGSSLYLFTKPLPGTNKDGTPKSNRILHCGDFRACPAHIDHPLLRPDVVDSLTQKSREQWIDTCYLDTTYLTPKYAFPSQHDVIDACAKMCVSLAKEITDENDEFEKAQVERMGGAMSTFLAASSTAASTSATNISKEDSTDIKPLRRGRLLVVIGTYSIGKERICLGIARALNSKIYAPPAKQRICACLEDEELNKLLTDNPLEAQVHMQTLMEIRAETLQEYLVGFRGQGVLGANGETKFQGGFDRVVGFRPTGWSYRPPTSRFTENPNIADVLYSEGWKSKYTMKDLIPQRGSTKEAKCFGVPYSEHSSFRELSMFICALRVRRVVPTVNVGSKKGREKMRGWIERWEAEKKKKGLFKVQVGDEGWGSGDGELHYGV